MSASMVSRLTLALAEESGGSTLTEYLDAGGWMMYVILTLSIVGLVFFLERAVDLYLLKRLNTKGYLKKVIGFIETKKIREALDQAQVRSKHPLVAVTREGLLRANEREKDVERAMEREMLLAMPKLQKRVALMSLLANIATLLGLLGTIFGLIAAFSAVSSASAAEKQSALAGGISQAMYTTAFGISVAVPMLFFHHFLARRMEQVMVEVEAGATAVMVALTGKSKSELEANSAGASSKSE